MKILMIGDIAFVGENLKKGLEAKGHSVLLDTDLHWSELLRKKYDKQNFDIVHINSPNFKKLGIGWRYLVHDTKLICHWHGSDLRHPLKEFPVYHYLLKVADFNLYSTVDLGWWLRKVPNDRKMLFICPVDTELFRPYNQAKHGAAVFNGGGRSFKVHKVPHDQMQRYLNQFEVVTTHKIEGLDDGLISVLDLEAAACGCRVSGNPWLNREWVINNASIESQTKKILDVYKKLLK
jgi:hypothetical protein